jgi:hypothetical protein
MANVKDFLQQRKLAILHGEGPYGKDEANTITAAGDPKASAAKKLGIQ